MEPYASREEAKTRIFVAGLLVEDVRRQDLQFAGYSTGRVGLGRPGDPLSFFKKH